MMMRTRFLFLAPLSAAIVAGCAKPAASAPVVVDKVVVPAAPAPSPQPSTPVADTPPPTRTTDLTVPDKVKTDAFDYYGLGITSPQKIRMTVTQDGQAAKSYDGTRTLTTRSVAEGKAEFAEAQAGGPEGDLTETVSAEPDGLYLEGIDPGQLKSAHQMLLPAHVAPGSTWTARIDLEMAGQSIDFTTTYKAEGLRDLETKLGKKQALYVTDEGTGTWGGKPYSQKEQWWYVKGIGPVKNISSESAGGKKFTAVLEIVG